jgi:hypothetical protein
LAIPNLKCRNHCGDARKFNSAIIVLAADSFIQDLILFRYRYTATTDVEEPKRNNAAPEIVWKRNHTPYRLDHGSCDPIELSTLQTHEAIRYLEEEGGASVVKTRRDASRGERDTYLIEVRFERDPVGPDELLIQSVVWRRVNDQCILRFVNVQ